jgi:hypothetical protein
MLFSSNEEDNIANNHDNDGFLNIIHNIGKVIYAAAIIGSSFVGYTLIDKH